MKIKGAKDLTFDKMIDGLGGDRESIDELTSEEANDTDEPDDTPEAADAPVV